MQQWKHRNIFTDVSQPNGKRLLNEIRMCYNTSCIVGLNELGKETYQKADPVSPCQLV